MDFLQNLITNRKVRPALRNPQAYTITHLRFIAIHWTANTDKGANAAAHRRYLQGLKSRFASAHYFVDDSSIIQTIPDNEVAYHVGDTSNGGYTDLGKTLAKGFPTPNYTGIGVEMCVNQDGDFSKTYSNTVRLTATLLLKHEMSIDDVHRHFDITHKHCPVPFLSNTEWNNFRNDVYYEVLDLKRAGNLLKTTTALNVRSRPNANAEILWTLKKGEICFITDLQPNGWGSIFKGGNCYINTKYLQHV